MMWEIGITKHDNYYKMRQKTVIAKLVEIVAEIYYKMRQVLQSVTYFY